VSGPRWNEIRAAFEDLLELDPAARARRLAALGAVDPGLRVGVEALLRGDAEVEERLGSLEASLGSIASPSGHRERLAAALAERYRIEGELGRGGMATVYVAHDLKHDRRVAIKVLRPELAAVLGAERFLQEIRTTAGLQHPHILPLFDSGAAEGFLYYVMPYVDGETLRQKLRREGQLGIAEAVRIVSDVAEALDHAHRHDVIHRDIKPENILLHDGRALVADFGIALAVTSAAGGRMTETGLSLGTPHYMSPEQATAERDLTPRSDIYSLGAVLYEMLTGEPPHAGATAQQILMKVATEEAPWIKDVRRSVPANVAGAVWKALEKPPADRFPGAGAFAAALADASFRAGPLSAGEGDGLRKWRRVAIAAMGTAAVLLMITVWRWLQSPTAVSSRVQRYEVVLPQGEGQQESVSGYAGIALSPDGSRYVYVGQGEGDTQLWLRRRDKLHATPLPGTEGAFNPFFSPDGTRVGFFVQGTGGNKLLVVSLSGGPPKVIAAGSEVDQGGGSWGPDGYIYIDGKLADDGIARVWQDGGQVEPVTVPDSTRGEAWHDRPYVLPNRKGVLFTSSNGRGTDEYEIGVIDLRTRAQHVLVPGTKAVYASSGYLVYMTADGTLMAAPFDPDQLKLMGDAVALGERVYADAVGESQLTVANDGTFMYATRASPNAVEGFDQVVTVTRNGEIQAIDSGFGGPVSDLALSPSGDRLALTIFANGKEHVWIKHRRDGRIQKLTQAAPWNMNPSWSTDGRSVMFLSLEGGALQTAIHERRADGSGDRGVVLDQHGWITRATRSHDGRWLVYQAADTIYGLRPQVDTAPRRLVASPERSFWPALSPNDRWLAYVSSESGTNEVYVVPFPDTRSRKRLLSIGGGTEPHWAHNGRELFYMDGRGELVAVQVTAEGAFAVGARQTLFTVPGFGGRASYDVLPDDRGFIMLRSSRRGRSGFGFVVVEHFFEELKETQR
jgi:Tol biopolymer transport system component